MSDLFISFMRENHTFIIYENNVDEFIYKIEDYFNEYDGITYGFVGSKPDNPYLNFKSTDDWRPLIKDFVMKVTENYQPSDEETLEAQQQEIDSLKHTVNALREVLTIVMSSGVAPYLMDESFKERVQEALSKNPHQHTTEHDAKVIREAVENIPVSKVGNDNLSITSILEYADKLEKDKD